MEQEEKKPTWWQRIKDKYYEWKLNRAYKKKLKKIKGKDPYTYD